jgi:hypothetical protein
MAKKTAYRKKFPWGRGVCPTCKIHPTKGRTETGKSLSVDTCIKECERLFENPTLQAIARRFRCFIRSKALKRVAKDHERVKALFAGTGSLKVKIALSSETPSRLCVIERSVTFINPRLTDLESIAEMMRLPVWLLLIPDPHVFRSVMWAHVRPAQGLKIEATQKDLQRIYDAEQPDRIKRAQSRSSLTFAGWYQRQKSLGRERVIGWVDRMRERDEDDPRYI